MPPARLAQLDLAILPQPEVAPTLPTDLHPARLDPPFLLRPEIAMTVA